MANKDFSIEFGNTGSEFYPLDKDLITDNVRGVPKNTPKETLSKLGKYSKNVLISTGKLTVDVGGKFVPNAQSFAASLADTAKLAAAEGRERLTKIKEFVTKNKSVDTDPIHMMDNFVKTVSDTKKDIVKRLKSGEFYKRDVDNFDMSGVFGDMDDYSFGTNDFDIGELDSGSTIHGDPETQLSAEPFGDTVTHSSDRRILEPRSVSGSTASKLSRNSFNVTNIKMGGNSGQLTIGDELVSGITADVGKAIISQQDRLFDKNFAAAEMRFSQHMEVQRGILSAMNATVNFLQNISGTSSAAGMEFQGKMIGMQQEQLALLKEIKEASIVAISPPTQTPSSSNAYNEIVNGGSLNSEAYWKNIKTNASDMLMKTSLGPLVGMLPMLGMMGSMTESMGVKQKFDPMSAALKFLVSSNVSMKTKAKLGAMNDLFSNAGSLFIGKMNDLANNSDNKLFKTMGQLLGIRDTYVKQTDFGLKDPDKVVGWSAKSDRTLNHVIPTQLGEIISALTGKEPEFYDYKEGKFVSKKEKKREYENLRKAAYTDYKLDATTGSMSISASTSESGRAAAKSMGMTPEEYGKTLEKDFRNIRLNIGATQSNFNPEAASRQGSYRSKLLKNVSSEQSLNLFIEQFGQLSSADSQYLNGRSIGLDRSAKQRMARFGEESLRYGGADVASDLQASDEITSLEDRLTNGFLSEAEINRLPDGSLKASRRLERAKTMDRISKLRSGNGIGMNAADQILYSGTSSTKDVESANLYKSASATLSNFGIVAETDSPGSQQNVYSTLNNIYSLLVGGILVYPQRGAIPKHIKAARDLISSKSALSKSIEKISTQDYDRAQREQEQAILETSKAQRISEQMSVFGPFDFYANMLGLRNENRRENSSINKLFNKGLDTALGGISKVFGNGNISNINSEAGDAYSQYMNSREADMRRDITKGINDAEEHIAKLKDSTSASDKAKLKYYTTKLSVLKKTLSRMDKVKANGGVSSTGMDDIIEDVKETSIGKKIYAAKEATAEQISNVVPDSLNQIVSEGITHAKAFTDNSSTVVNKKVSEAKDTVNILGSAIQYVKTVPNGEQVSKDELRDAIEVSAIENGKTQEEAKSYADVIVTKISSVGTSKESILRSLGGILDSARTRVSKKTKSIRSKAAKSAKTAKENISKTFEATAAKENDLDSDTLETSNLFDTFITDTKGHAHLDVLAKLFGKGALSAGKLGLSATAKALGLGGKGLGMIGSGLGTATKTLFSGASNLANKSATRMTGKTVLFNKLEDLKYKAIETVFTSRNNQRSKEEIEEERKAVRAAYNSIDALEEFISGKLDPDETIAKRQVYKLIDEQIKLGALDKSIGTLLKDGVAHFVALGYPPDIAFSKMKDKIRAKYDKSYRKEMAGHNPFIKVAKSLGKWTGTAAGATLAIASGHPLAAATIVGVALRSNPLFQKMVKENFDRKSTSRKLKASLDGKAVNKYGAEVSAFDSLLGISAMSKLSDKELQREQELAAATFKALEEIEIWANENVPPSDEKGGDKIASVIRASIKNGAIDKDIGNMVIDRIKANVAKGKPAIEALTEAKATIQKNYSKLFKKEQRRRGTGSKILRGFGKGLGIAAIAMYNPLMAALLVGREIAAHKQRKKDKENADQRDEINEIRGTASIKEKSKADKDQERKGIFAKLKGWNDDRKESARLATKVVDKGDVETEPTKSETFLGKAKAKVGNIFGGGLREGSFEDQKRDKKADEKEQREKEQLVVFKDLSTTLTSIRKGLGILDKGEHIDEKDTETFAGKLDEILGATKTSATLQAAAAESASPGIMAKMGGILVKAGGVAPKVATGLGAAAIAATAAIAIKQTSTGIKRWKEEGWQSGVGELTGLDKQSESMFNSDGTRKEADFHIGGENGFDVDVDRGIGRAPAKRVLLNAKTHMSAVKNAGNKVGDGLKKLGNKMIQKGGGLADNVAGAASKGGIPSKVLGKVKDCLEKFFKKGKVAKLVGDKGKDIVAKITGRLKNTSLVKKLMAKGAGKNFLKQIPLIGLGVAIVGAVADFVNGMSKTNRYFKISASDNATIGMKIAAGLAESLPGLLGAIPGIGLFAGIISALIPPDWVAQTVYKLFASKKDEEELAAKQEAFQKKAEELGIDPDRLNEYENKSLGQKITGAFKSQEKKDLEDARLLGFGDDVDAYKEWKKKYDASKGKTGSASEAIVEKGEEGNAITGTVPNGTAAAIATGTAASLITPALHSTNSESSSKYSEANKVMAAMPENDKANAAKAMGLNDTTSSDENRRRNSTISKAGTVAAGTAATLAKKSKEANTVKESPFVTNDKLLIQQLEATLAVQKEIRDEMFRHNSSVEQFITYMVDYLEKGKKAKKKEEQEKKKNDDKGWFANLFKNNSASIDDNSWRGLYSTSDSEMAYDASRVATGTSS